jgi:hypothetical protein
MREGRRVWRTESAKPPHKDKGTPPAKAYLMNDGRGSLRVYPSPVNTVVSWAVLGARTKVDDEGKIAAAMNKLAENLLGSRKRYHTSEWRLGRSQ